MPINSFKEDENHAELGKRQTVLRLFSYLLAYKKQIIGVLAVMLFCVCVSLMNPLFVETAIDTCIGSGDLAGLARLILLALTLNVAMVLFTRLRMLIMNKICNSILMTIRQELYTHIQTLDFHFFDSRPTGKILSRIIGDVNSLKDVLGNCVTTLIPDFITLIAVILIMLVKSPALTAASLCALPLLAAGVWYIQTKSHSRWQLFRKKASNMNAFIHEDLSGMRIIQSFHAEAETDNTFYQLTEEHRKAFTDACRINDAIGSVIDFCWGLSTAALFYTGIVLLGPDQVSVGTLLAFGTFIGMFWRPIMNLSDFYKQLITNLAAAERVFEVLDTPSEITDERARGALNPVKGEVVFDKVSFAYSDAPNVMVLEDVSFHVKPGETIALVGPTGAGKTTIVNLISRFYNATRGRVLIDGQDVQEVTLNSLRSQLGIMTQDNFLFTGTVMENIRYGRLEATDEECIAAARAVNAHDFIMKLEKGYETELTERGGGLSVGQKQLLAFARTFVSMPGILILDEATSSIDTKTEVLVQSGIEALLAGRTSFVIAHRLSTIQKADRILVIDNRGILEEGSARELMRRKGAYYQLYMAQFAEAQ